MNVQPIRAGSVAEPVYAQIRSLIVDGTLAPNARLNQGDLAEAFGISRTSIREALHRLTADELVQFQQHRGFFVAAPLRLDAVLGRLEARLLLEPGIARLAAARRTLDDVDMLYQTVTKAAQARAARTAHDLSREFHFVLARCARNPEFVRILESLWMVDIGRQLLSRRVMSPTWQAEDVAEHQAIAEAVDAGDADTADELMREHLQDTYSHWAEEAAQAEAGV